MKKYILLFIFSLLAFATNIQAQNWVQVGSDIDGEAAGDYSGTSVSISSDGTTLAIGAPSNQDNGLDSGQVRIYKNISGAWTQIGQDINGEATGDNSGISVSLNSDGSIVAIGAYFNSENGQDSGHVRIYQNISGTWTQMGQDIDGEAADDHSGESVSLSSDGLTVAIGASKNDGSGIDSGHVRIYQYVSGAWVKIGADIDGEAAGDESGTSVSLSSDGSIIAIGAPNNGGYSGHVRVYQNISGTWTQIGADIDGEAVNDMSGTSVSLNADGSIVAIGAPRNAGNGSNSGHVRVYQNISGTWTQIGADIDGEAGGDMSGNSVSLSADGTIVAIGASRNDGNGADSGHVRVYQNNSGTWTRMGTDINGEAAGDYSGFSTSLSSDGAIVAIGAPYNDGNGGVSGQVRAYYFLHPPAITSQPVNQNNICLASNISFTISGSDIATYQWQVDEGTGFVNITNGSVYSGATTETLSITGVTTAMNNYQYRCFVTNAIGNALSNAATLTTDDENPMITCPSNQTINLNQGETYYTVSGTEFDPISTSDNCNVASVINDFNTTATLAGAQIPIGTTTIEWTITDDAGNHAACSFDIEVIAYVGISELQEAGISIYPNPSSGVFSIKNAENYEITITDITGKTVYHTTATTNEQVRLQQSGVYVINFRSETTSFSYKIIVE